MNCGRGIHYFLNLWTTLGYDFYTNETKNWIEIEVDGDTWMFQAKSNISTLENCRTHMKFYLFMPCYSGPDSCY